MSKVQTIQNYLKAQNIDAAFVTTPDNVFYLSGFKSNPHERLLGIMIFQDAEPFLVCPKMEVPDALAAGWSFEAVGHEDTDNAWVLVYKAIESRGIQVQTFAIEKSHLTVERLESLEGFFPTAKFVGLDDQLNHMRLAKTADELQNLREAAALADYAIEIGVSEIAEGKTELEILSAIESAMKEKGVYMSFDTMVLTGLNATSPHGTPGTQKVQKGDLVLFDLGVVYNGYCSDITRTVAFGEPTNAQKEIYEAVKNANEVAIDAVKPGVRAMDLDKISRDVITKAGYGEYFTHRLGHGLGITVHEFPSIHGANEMAIQEGMVFTIEPGIYKGDVAGVRFEDDVYVTADGVEVLTKFQKELKIIEA